MSNLIQYIVQDDPEEELKNKTSDKQTYTSYIPTQKVREESYQKIPQNLFETVLASNQSNQTPIPLAKRKSGNLLERINNSKTSVSKRVEYNTPDLKRSSVGDIVLEGIKGFGEGIEQGSLALFNARIGGLYDLVSYLYMDDDYAKRQDKMQKRAESVGLGGANKVANLAIDAGGTSKLLKKLGLKYIK